MLQRVGDGVNPMQTMSDEWICEKRSESEKQLSAAVFPTLQGQDIQGLYVCVSEKGKCNFKAYAFESGWHHDVYRPS